MRRNPKPAQACRTLKSGCGHCSIHMTSSQDPKVSCKDASHKRSHHLHWLQHEVTFGDHSPIDSLCARGHRNRLEVEFAFRFVSWLEADSILVKKSEWTVCYDKQWWQWGEVSPEQRLCPAARTGHCTMCMSAARTTRDMLLFLLTVFMGSHLQGLNTGTFFQNSPCVDLNQAWRFTPVTPALGRWKKEDWVFKVILTGCEFMTPRRTIWQ